MKSHNHALINLTKLLSLIILTELAMENRNVKSKLKRLNHYSKMLLQL